MTAHDIVLYGATGFAGQLVADTSDWPSIDAMVSKARVVVTTAGPYAEHRGEDRARRRDRQRPLGLGHPVRHRATRTAGPKGGSRESALHRVRRFVQRRHEENPTSKILGEGLVAAEGGELMQFRVLAET